MYLACPTRVGYRAYNPMGSMEPPWLRFLNLANTMFALDTRHLSVKKYVRDLHANARLGPYVWTSLSGLIRFLQTYLGEFPRDLLPWGALAHRARVTYVSSQVSTAVKLPPPSRKIPGRNPVSIKLGLPKENSLFGRVGTLSSLPSAVLKLQRLFGIITEDTGRGNIPTWYPKRFGLSSWKFRKKVRGLKPSDKILTLLLRLHYIWYVVRPRELFPGKVRINQCVRRSDADLSTGDLTSASKGRNFYQATARLYKRLKVLFTSSED